MILAMLTGTLPFGALTVQAETPQKSGMEELSEQADDSDPFAYEKGSRVKSKSAYPETFDLRHVDEGGTEKSYITPVKVQNPYGTCWGFAAVAAAESSLLSTGLAAQRGYDVNTLDLSEKQIAWFATNPINDPDNPQYGEGSVFRAGITPQDKYNGGGGTCFATNLFATGVGPVDEDTVTDDGNIFAYRGRNGEVNSERVTWFDELGNEQSCIRKTSYSDEDDWVIPDKYRFYHNYELKESYLLPNPVSMDGEYHPEATEAIKEQLLNKRAVSISIQATHSVAGEDESLTEDYTMSANWAQYCEWVGQNHVVTIVGYDDNYPVENFVKNNQPPGKGAWLVKNSWGSDLNDFPNNGYAHWGLYEGQDVVGSNYETTSNKHTGYFWLSYYDNSINGPEAYVFEINDKEYNYNQHDYLPVVEYGEYATQTESKMSNVFTAKGNEELKDVSVFTATPGTTLSYKVYILAENAAYPEDGICVYQSQEKEYPYGGYHRETLNAENGIYLCKGQKYSVVVSEKTPSGKYSISFGKSEIEPRHASNPRSFHSVINKGESFLFIDGEWKDMSDEEVLNTLLVDKDGYVWNVCADNFPIKAFTVASPSNGAYLIITNRNKYNIEDEIVLKQNDPMPLLAQFKGATDELDEISPAITWESTDSEILSVENEAGNDYKANITGRKAGIVYLNVSAGKYGTRVIKINVRKYLISVAKFINHNQEIEYTGSEIKPKVERVGAETDTEDVYDYNTAEGTDYTTAYSNNVLCGRATACVTGIGEYDGVVNNNEFSNDLSFIIVPSKAKINSVKQVNDKLKVSFTSQKEQGITGYVLYYKARGTNTVKSIKLDASAESAVISGLTFGKTYDVYLKAYVTTFDDSAIYNEEWDYYEEGYVDHFGKASDTISKKLTVKAPKFGKIKSDKNAFTAKWSKVKYASGYQLQYSVSKKFKKGKKYTKTVNVKKAKTVSKKVKKLTSGKKYYVRVRAYKTVNGKRYYSTWSKKKAVKAK